jgi:hypothetical protein
MTNPIVFSNIGMGISAAGQWVDINGRAAWVHFLATAEGAGRHTRLTSKKRTWHVTASVGDKRVMLTKVNCTRVDAVAAVLAELPGALAPTGRREVAA